MNLIGVVPKRSGGWKRWKKAEAENARTARKNKRRQRRENTKLGAWRLKPRSSHGHPEQSSRPLADWESGFYLGGQDLEMRGKKKEKKREGDGNEPFEKDATKKQIGKPQT